MATNGTVQRFAKRLLCAESCNSGLCFWTQVPGADMSLTIPKGISESGAVYRPMPPFSQVLFKPIPDG